MEILNTYEYMQEANSWAWMNTYIPQNIWALVSKCIPVFCWIWPFIQTPNTYLWRQSTHFISDYEEVYDSFI